MDIREGRILKGIGGSYTVYADNEYHTCRARGRFREQGITPMVGDRVEYSPPESEGEGYILTILPRNNELNRPPVSNIDRLVAVVSAGRPKPDLMLVDRLLVDARIIGVVPMLAVNKIDLAPDGGNEITDQYRHLPILAVSARTGQGLDDLAAGLMGHTACFAGQSGVGKTSIINGLRPGQEGEVGALSDHSRRGKHTTRHSELMELPGGGWVVDTPGFSLLETEPMDPGTLGDFYPEFAPYEGQCRFADCRHDRETGCAVLEAVDRGDIHPQRHLRYTELLRELTEKWRNRYE